MKNFYIWLRWKLFDNLGDGTCWAIKENLGTAGLRQYEVFLKKQGLEIQGTAEGFRVKAALETHPKTYKQMRRDFMWRFLVKGER